MRMRRIIAACCFIVPSLLLLAAVLHPAIVDRVHRRIFSIEPSELSSYYHQTRATIGISARLVPEGSVFLIGDSISQGLPLGLLGNPAVNYGIAGDTTFGVLNRLDDYHYGRASLTIVAIGVNDLSRRKVPEIASNVRRIAEAISRYCPVVVSPVLPVDESRSTELAGFNEKIRELNFVLAGTVSTLDSVTFLSEVSCGFGSSLSPELHTGDGVHLSSAGYELLIPYLRNAVERCRR
jgi:lysophospholipase L1-like esterase